MESKDSQTMELEDSIREIISSKIVAMIFLMMNYI